MDNNIKKNLEKAAALLGIEYEGITELPEESLNSISAVIDVIQVKNDSDAENLYSELHRLWHRGVLENSIRTISDTMHISYDTMAALPIHIREQLCYQFLLDSENAAEINNIIQTAITVAVLPDVAELIKKNADDLEALPFEVQEHICGMYNMEYTSDGDNAELANDITEYLNTIWL